MRDILWVFSAGTGDTLIRSATYAISLGKATGAHLTALMVDGEPTKPIPQMKLHMQNDVGEVPSTSVYPVSFTKAVNCLIDAAKHSGTEYSVFLISSASPNFREVLIGTAQVRDLIVFDVQGPLQHPMLDWVQAILFGSGRPIILAPPGADPVFNGTIIFAWDESRSAVRALFDILPRIIGSREVVVVSVLDNKQARNSGSGEWICSYLERWGVTARFHPITQHSDKVGVDLLGFAEQMNADVLVMGAFGHSREREFIFGSATRDIFQSRLEIPIFLSHELETHARKGHDLQKNIGSVSRDR